MTGTAGFNVQVRPAGLPTQDEAPAPIVPTGTTLPVVEDALSQDQYQDMRSMAHGQKGEDVDKYGPANRPGKK